LTFENFDLKQHSLSHFEELTKLLSDLPNYQMVNDNLSRGGQPTDRGFVRLKEEGFKTVINLREEQMQILNEEKLVKGMGLNYHSVALNPFFKPQERDIERFLRLATDPANQPVFVHCLHGQDRTGMAVGIYRMIVEGFSLEDAYEEMLALGFHAEFVFLKEATESYGGKKLEDVLGKL